MIKCGDHLHPYYAWGQQNASEKVIFFYYSRMRGAKAMSFCFLNSAEFLSFNEPSCCWKY
jgi:hypothetical protein